MEVYDIEEGAGKGGSGSECETRLCDGCDMTVIGL